MRKYIPHMLFVLLVAGVATASAIKVWTTGETLRAADLNSNFTHIHNTKVGDGTLLVNADVSASAAIAHSKLATPFLVPKAAAYVTGSASATCTASPCLASPASGVTSVTRIGAGVYEVTMSTARATIRYAVIVSAMSATNIHCGGTSPISTTVFRITCVTADTAAAADAEFSFVVHDN